MKFIELTHVAVSDYPVYINAAHVVAVRKSSEQQTYVLIAAAGADGRLSHIAVRESPEDVVARLQG